MFHNRASLCVLRGPARSDCMADIVYQLSDTHSSTNI